MACLAGLGGGIYALASGGGSKQEPGQKNTPPINASSSDEADYIKCAKLNEPNVAIAMLTISQEVPRVCRQEELSDSTWERCGKGLYDEVYIQSAQTSRQTFRV